MASIPGPRRSTRPGFSILELLLALGIFSTAFLMIMSVFPTSAKAMHQGRQVLLATRIAEMQMESALASPWADLASTNPTTPSLISMVNGSTEVQSFNTQVVVTPVGMMLKSVRCQVSWMESVAGQTSGILRYVNLETMVANL